MTVILGLVDDDGIVHIACDSCAIAGNEIESYGNKKVFSINKFIFGVCGSFRAMDIIKYLFEPKAYSHYDWHSAKQYMVACFVPDLIKCLKKNKALLNTEGIATVPETGLLVGFHGNLFVIDSDFQVGCLNQTNFFAIGSGSSPAKGSLFTSFYEGFDAEKSLSVALHSCANFSQYVKAPFYYINTDYFDVREIE